MMSELGQGIVFAIAAILHGITGMGFPMLGTSALAFVMPLPDAVAMVALPSLLMSLLVLCTNNRQSLVQELGYYLKRYQLLAISSVIGGIIGVWMLLILSVAWLYLLMSLVTVYYAGHGLLTLFGKANPIIVPTHIVSMTSFGLVAGIIGGATNAMSPILLIFLFSLTNDKNHIAKASNLCYLLGKVVQIILLKDHYLSYNSTQYTLLITLTFLSMLALFVGVWLRNKISTTVFKGLIFGILLLLALKIGYAGIVKLLA